MPPIPIGSISDLLVNVSRELRAHGWALLCTTSNDHPFQFTVGLEAGFGHPELEVIGLTPELGQTVLERLVERVKAGQRLQSGDFFSDVLKGFDVFVVDNPIELGGPPLTRGRLRAIWPDANHRYPWQAGCEASCAAQSLLIEPDSLDRHGLEALFTHTGRLA